MTTSVRILETDAPVTVSIPSLNVSNDGVLRRLSVVLSHFKHHILRKWTFFSLGVKEDLFFIQQAGTFPLRRADDETDPVLVSKNDYD